MNKASTVTNSAAPAVPVEDADTASLALRFEARLERVGRGASSLGRLAEAVIDAVDTMERFREDAQPFRKKNRLTGGLTITNTSGLVALYNRYDISGKHFNARKVNVDPGLVDRQLSSFALRTREAVSNAAEIAVARVTELRTGLESLARAMAPILGAAAVDGYAATLAETCGRFRKHFEQPVGEWTRKSADATRARAAEVAGLPEVLAALVRSPRAGEAGTEPPRVEPVRTDGDLTHLVTPAGSTATSLVAAFRARAFTVQGPYRDGAMLVLDTLGALVEAPPSAPATLDEKARRFTDALRDFVATVQTGQTSAPT